MRLHNTLTGKVEEFKPAGEELLMYVCGITPYAESHLGHAMSYIIFDTLRRYFEFKGWKVKHVQNYTDIDDKLIMRAEREGASINDIAGRYIEQFEGYMEALNVQKAHLYPRATQELPGIIEIIERLVEKGYAYAGPPKGGNESSDVYYRVEKKKDYGKLSKRSLDSMQAGARIEPLEGKENPMDFTLWKGSKPGEPAWDSPWGPGRPGWHIECSAMSFRHLGPQIDLHGGGFDLLFPHHENEIAQTEAYTEQVPFSRFWIHHGMLQLGEEKMSKSTGRLVTIGEGLEKFGADALRIFVLGSSYRSPLTYTEEAVEAAKSAAARLRTALEAEETGRGDAVDPAPFHDRFVASMEDDLNAAGALASLFDLAREINRARDAGRGIGAAQSALRELSSVLGLKLESEAPVEAAPFIELLISLRRELREAKQYQLADRIRHGLGELGIVLEDGAGGTTWKVR